MAMDETEQAKTTGGSTERLKSSGSVAASRKRRSERKPELERCPMCDEWYDPNGNRAAIHLHPEPQSGPERAAWLKSGLSWEEYSKADPAHPSDGVAASRRSERGAVEIKPLDPQPTYELIRPIVDKTTGEVWAYCDGPQGIFVPKPGDRVPVREEWQLSCFIDVGAAYGNHCSEADQKSLKYVLQYRDEDGDMQAARTIWPSDPLYPKCRELVTCYEDECRERPASEIPDWAARRWNVVKSVRVCHLDSVTDAEALAAGYGNRQLDVWPLDDLYEKLKLNPESWVSVVTYQAQGTSHA